MARMECCKEKCPKIAVQDLLDVLTNIRPGFNPRVRHTGSSDSCLKWMSTPAIIYSHKLLQHVSKHA